jgi:UDP-N-acetylglucosamine--N-acetylmuramyl-(pentapeptide) pyrophosphoryl-undecaprenol N-acetylglucosamine transferase
MIRVAIACGGTGGHIYPALAVAQALRDREPSTDVLFIGSGGIESRIIPATGWPFRRIAARQLSRRISWTVPWAVCVAGVGAIQAGRYLRAFRPAAVLSTGGYAAAPVGAAATMLRIPLVLQEQNLYPGLTNRLLRRSARAVSVPHESAARFFGSKAVVTGVPIDRARVLNGARARGLQRFGLDPARTTILVLGGSQGARTINEAMVEAAPRLTRPEGVQILHQAGPAHETTVRNRAGTSGALRYVVVGYIENVADAYACADLVVCRAGASTLAEVTACGLPCIIVPYPYAAEGHQEANARVHERAGAALVLLDRELNGERLAALLNRLRDDPAAARAMAAASAKVGRPEAADRVAALVASAAGEEPM